MSDFAKALVAETVQQNEMFGPPEGSEFFAVLDNRFGRSLADVWDSLQFVLTGGVYIYGLLC